ncbi:MAG TPA: chorismate synthase [Actinomycetota bacterium]
MLRFLTAGESHGPALVATIEGMVAGVPISGKMIRAELARRRHGYGRGTRMKLEEDRLEILGGVRHGRTIGSPVAMVIRNTEWPKWQQIMAPEEEDAAVDDPALTRPRPGHADLAGMLKYDAPDARNILERASARETAARTAIGAVCKSFLAGLGVQIVSHVTSIGTVAAAPAVPARPEDLERIDAAALRCLDAGAEQQMIALIDAMRKQGDTLGGVFEVVVWGLPPGVGSHVHWDRRLDASLAHAMMSIQAIKGVEIGRGFEIASMPGSEAHDEIGYEAGEFARRTVRAGGTEGGMSIGGPVIVRAAMKPLSSLARPLQTVDVNTKDEAVAITQRSDVCAVPAAAVVGEAMAAFAVAAAVLDKFGGDSLTETKRNLDSYTTAIKAR